MSTNLRVAIFFLLAVLKAQAHDPFDCSSRMTVSDEQIEITVTTGLDAAKLILGSGGLSPEEVAAAVRQRGPHSIHELPATLAAGFFEVKTAGDKLTATSMGGLSDGMEVIFKVAYPRPATGTLQLRALYFNAVEQMRPGAFIAYDEDMKLLGSALLSRARVDAQVTLPPVMATTQPGVVEVARISGTASNNAATIPIAASSAGPTKLAPSRAGWFCALAILAAGAWFATRKPAKIKNTYEP